MLTDHDYTHRAQEIDFIVANALFLVYGSIAYFEQNHKVVLFTVNAAPTLR